ncbi:MAG: transcription antitermination factor NusB [Coriobacteriia bacterium]
MLERTRARRQALQILYQREITEQPVTSILGNRSYSEEDGEPSEYAWELALGTEANGAVIDREIESTSQHWALMRMPFVDRNILRLAVYEILFQPQVPDSVAINEAVEMAKAYGTDDSPKFVNGVLGRIAEVHGSSPSDGRSEADQEGAEHGDA